MYAASSEEGDWPGRGVGRGAGVLMLNKLSVLFVSLRPSQAFFFFFQIESVHDGYFLGS